jgi:uncharacterized membrane protein (UPF0182 family)
MEPYYLILRLPNEPKEEFVLLIPFTPSKKDNPAAWLAARSDPPHYGKLGRLQLPQAETDLRPPAEDSLYIAAEKGQLPELKRVIVGFGDRIAMEETLEGAMARVFGGPAQRAGAEAAPSPPAGATGSVKALLDDAASALTRANESCAA